MEQLCDSTFSDLNRTWYSEDLEFTECFEKITLVWIPCFFLWICLPFEVRRKKNNKCPIVFNLYSRAKLVLMFVLLCLSIIEASYNVFVQRSFTLADTGTPLLKVATFTAAMSLTYSNFTHGVNSSYILFVFSFLLAICGAPQFRREFQSLNFTEETKKVMFSLYVVYYPTVIAAFILNCFSDSQLNASPGDKRACPQKSSSALSKILFAWFDPIIWKGFKHPMKVEYLWKLDPSNRSVNAVAKFENIWRKSFSAVYSNIQYHTDKDAQSFTNVNDIKSTRMSSIVPVIAKTYWRLFLYCFVVNFSENMLQLVNPIMLSWIIDFVSGNEPAWRGYMYAVGLFLAVVTEILLFSQYLYHVRLISLRLKTALISLIYKKALRISNGTRKRYTTGEIVNLMSIDVDRIANNLHFIDMLWAPLTLVAAAYYLWKILGIAAIAGILVIILAIPLNSYLSIKLKDLQVKQMEKKDQRINLMNQILCGIKVLKLYAWEESFEKQIKKLREKEIQISRKQVYVNAAISFVCHCAPFLITIVTFTAFVLSSDEHILDAKTAFVSVSLMSILRFPLNMIPAMVSRFIQAKVSVRRINQFFYSEELDPEAVSHEKNLVPIIIEKASFSWDGYDEPPVLHDINVSIKSGNLVAVVGPVGAGKSSLISAILGEMYKIHGFVNTYGDIAFVSQQAWIRNGTIKDNIVFNTDFNYDLYNSVIKSCALDSDIQILPAGDRTEIGEKGINISGGQKQRISLARAVYIDADIYLLDDPLSAVDSHVGKHIFENIIGPTGLLNHKTRIFVTHNVTYLSQVDSIIVLKDGSIAEVGTLDELLAKAGAFQDFFLTYSNENNVSAENDTLHQKHTEAIPEKSSEDPRKIIFNTDSAVGEKLIEEEKEEIGSVKWKVYLCYISLIGSTMLAAIIFSSLLTQLFMVASNIWLSIWTDEADKRVNGTSHSESSYHYIGIYASLGFGQGICQYIAFLFIWLGAWKSAKKLHNALLSNILKAPLTFFDVTPVGRLLARFSKDVDILDTNLPESISETISTFNEIASILFIIGYSVPRFILLILPIAIVYCILQRCYVATSRHLKRLLLITTSPIYSHFGETIAGAPAIRAYNQQSNFILESEKKVDTCQNIFYHSFVSERWLAVRLELIGSFVIFFTALFAVMGKGVLNGSIVGLSISFAIQITYPLNWLVQMSSRIETDIVAAERIKEYTEIIQERSRCLKPEPVSETWPENGNILFDDFKVRYRPGLDLVLCGITFNVSGGQKIGIVGRTGAGKSSLTLSLFRIIESAGGKILIDGVDISTLGLYTLRSRLTIIPQDPVLFSGSLRINIDPDERYPDDKIWQVLELAHLKSFVSQLPEGLQYGISEGGENLSVGQRQLICLARALLRKTKILILDEATAAVDLETDTLIQITIRKEFKYCTILTVAHRLHTIMDYDKIIVLDNGQIAEFDSPNSLMGLKDSLFYAMAKDARIS